MKLYKKLGVALALSLVAVFGGLFGLNGVFAKAEAPATVEMEEKYLTYAVVSDVPVELTSKVYYADGNYDYTSKTEYTVVSGGDKVEIRDGNKLYVKAAGSFSIKASVVGNASVFDTVNGEAYALTFSNVRILSKIEDVTVYTQPILLVGRVEVEGIDFIEDVHSELVYSVVSGPADIFCEEYLRFNGAGTVVLKASSKYDPNAFTTVEIEVTDPDAGLDADENASFTQGDLVKTEEGCSSAIGGLSVGLALLPLAIFARKRKQ